MNTFPWLSTITLIPVLGAAAAAGVKSTRDTISMAIGSTSCVAALVLLLVVCFKFDSGPAGYQFVEHIPWIPTLGVHYHLGIDGLGLLMLLLTSLVFPFAIFATKIPAGHSRSFISLMLLLQAGLFGAFTALDFFHWFLFWELTLVPAYFLIKLWGGPARSAAALQFFVYTFAGSMGMLIAFLALFAATGTFDLVRLAELSQTGDLHALVAQKFQIAGLTGNTLSMLLFWGVFLAFAVKVPVIPFHTWLPTTYAEAPVSVTMVLTGAMSKMGVYGMLRVMAPLFPDQMRAAATILLWLAVATIVFSAYAALAQPDLKRTVAYSSINHLGYCLLGIFAAVSGDPMLDSARSAALCGVLLQTFNHGITAAALFCFIGWLEARSGTQALDSFGGLRQITPVLCGLMGFTIFAALGLPGLNGFPGEFLIFSGTFPLASWAACLSLAGLMATAVFLLVLMQRVFHGPLTPRLAGLTDLTTSERLLVGPMVALMLVLGVWPQAVLSWTNATVLKLLQQLG